MDEAREIYTVKDGEVTLRECVISATNRHRFKVRNGNRVLYEGESYQQAKSLYEELSGKTTEPVERAVNVMSLRPRRRFVRPRSAYAEAS